MTFKEFISNLDDMVVKKPKTDNMEDIYTFQILSLVLKLVKYLSGRTVIYNTEKYQELIEKYNIENDVYKLYFKKKNRKGLLSLLVQTVLSRCKIKTITKRGKKLYCIDGVIPSDIENKIVKMFIMFKQTDEKAIRNMLKKEKNRVKLKKKRRKGKRIYKIELQD